VSHHSLQRALVVALHDPAFAAAWRIDPTALAPFHLDAPEVAQLLAIDPRAFTIDRLRSRRVLKAIVEELKASMAIALAETKTHTFADDFFASPTFRTAIIEDRPLVLALADYLEASRASGRLTSPHLPGVLAIERAQAEARRDDERARPGLSVSPGIRLVATDSAVMAALQTCEQHLFELALLPHLALCQDLPPLSLPARTNAQPLYLAVRASNGAVALTELPEPLFRTLSALTAEARLERAAIPAILTAIRLRVADPSKLIDDLIADGYLIESPAE
jgi:hypothetical protein